jgi:hypothetical protein
MDTLARCILLGFAAVCLASGLVAWRERVWGPRYQRESILCRNQLAAIWASIQQYHQRFDAWPNDLVDLYAADLIEPYALCCPASTAEGDMQLAAASDRAGKTTVLRTTGYVSYRYFLRDGRAVLEDFGGWHVDGGWRYDDAGAHWLTDAELVPHPDPATRPAR